MTDGDVWVGPAAAPDTYRLVALLGGGGEGEVWRAELPLSTSGRTTVAVKIVQPDAAVDWVPYGHLLRSLAHPGLVRVTDVFTGPLRHRRGEADPASVAGYVVMDHIDGPTLREWCDENPDATGSQRLRMLRTVAAALDEMHSGAATGVPVAHGDVKPANIVVRENGAGSVLVDLGLVRLTDAAGGSGRSAPYAAPELRVPGAQATPEADRYAFAVTTAQVLTGQRPPTGPDGWTDLPALHSLLRAAPVTRRRPLLVRTVMEAITAPPEGRPRELRRWLDSTGDALSQVTDVPGTPVAAEPRPRRWFLTTAALLAALAVGAGVTALGMRTSAGPSTSAALPTPDAATPSAAPTERTGQVTGLVPEQGFDFELDEAGGPEDKPGLDISGQSDQYHFDSLATGEGGLLKRLPPRSGPYTRQDCDPAVPGWTKNVPGVAVGRSICVITEEGNIALLTITKPWTGPDPDGRTVGFTYRLWYR
ncbi:protein kinase domain-containing protein [Pseudonocardia sp. CA-107938]|uniref:protein kinase domain-containing protein n=1 Tax=Pseudonocardia sp. CA-107938 TaxID=3240021 RepID=UPI003D9106EC